MRCIEVYRPYHKAFKPVPNGHEREAKKEAKRAAKLSDERFKGVDKNLFFNEGVLRDGPKAESDLILWKGVVGQIFEVGVDKVVLLVTAGLLAKSHSCNLGHVGIQQEAEQLLKVSETINCQNPEDRIR